MLKWIQIATIPVLSLVVWLFTPAATPTPNYAVVLALAPSKPAYLMDGPMGITLTITNASKENIQVDYMYPTGVEAEFSMENYKRKIEKSSTAPDFEMLEGMFDPVLLRSGETYKATVFLNKWLKFRQPGQYDLPYTLTTSVSRVAADGKVVPNSGGTITSSGVIQVVMDKPDDAATQKVLNAYAETLKRPYNVYKASPAEKQARAEAKEALLEMRTPLAIAPLTQIVRVEGAAIRHLDEFGTPDAIKAIISAVPSKNPDVVQEVLTVLQKRRILLSVDQVRHIVNNIDPNSPFRIADALCHCECLLDLHRRSVYNNNV